METFQSVLCLGKKMSYIVTPKIRHFLKVRVGIKSPSPHEKLSSSKSGWVTRDARLPVSTRHLPQEVDLMIFQSHLHPVFSLLSPAPSLSSLRELGLVFLRDIESRPLLWLQGTRRAAPSSEPPCSAAPTPALGVGAGPVLARLPFRRSAPCCTA